MLEQRVLVLLGGEYHPFDEAEPFLGDLLASLGLGMRATRDPAELGALTTDTTDLALVYTCRPDKLGEAAAGLVRFVEAGGGFLPWHSATASFQTDYAFHQLAGARFVMHPPRQSFIITPMRRPHPVIEGIDEFVVHDEVYVQDCIMGIDVHAVTNYLGKALPMVYTREVGMGRVCYVAPGHDAEVWKMEPVRRLLCNAIEWCIKRR
jgi:type 1 glutamine amidotransferase